MSGSDPDARDKEGKCPKMFPKTIRDPERPAKYPRNTREIPAKLVEKMDEVAIEETRHDIAAEGCVGFATERVVIFAELMKISG